MRVENVVHAGWVWSRTDGDRHWVGGRDLIRLYGLNPATTAVVNPNTLGAPRRVWPKGVRHLYPRADGRYRLDGDVDISTE